MRAGRKPYPPHPTESRYVFYSYRDWSKMMGYYEQEMEKAFKDSLLFGLEGIHVSESGDIERIPPATIEETILRKNAEEWDGKWAIEKISVEQVIERYGDMLTEEQIKQLKNHERK